MLRRPAAPEPGSELFSKIDFSGGAVIAVSGGSDSLALLLLVRRYLAATSPATRLLAVTVDHGLRSGSADEASAVSRLCGANAIAHRTFRWTGPKPASGLAAAAREARYRLLAQAARDCGLGMIVTGHTEDDQAETVIMRMARGPDLSARGLAGMAPATLYDGHVWIVRPLLRASRAALRVFLLKEGIGWTDDPTNADQRFERPRVRAKAFTTGDRDAVLATAEAAARRRVELARRAAMLIRRHVNLASAGLLRIDPALLSESDREAATYALQLLVATIGGLPFLPDDARIKAIMTRLASEPQPAVPRRRVLARCMIDWRSAGLFLLRERRGMPGPASVAAGMIWDGRRRITLQDRTDGLVIAPLGGDNARALLPNGMANVPVALCRDALATEPALWRNDDFIGVLSGAGACGTPGAEPVAAHWARFLPGFDLEAARAVRNVLGASSMPPPPVAGHIAA